MREAIEKRISRRTYTTEHLNSEIISRIQTLIDEINTVSGLSLQFVEDGSTAFASARKTYGMFKNVRSLILLKGPTDLPDLREKTGYYGEGLMLDLVDMDLGTCWVGGTFDRDTFAVPEGESLVLCMLVGQIDRPTLKDRIMISQAHNKRRPMEERLTSDAPIPDWLKAGMEAVLPAPSAVNKQKPHFDYKGGVLTASVPDEYAMDLVDLGIAKKHFEFGAGGRFAFGNGAAYKKEAVTE